MMNYSEKKYGRNIVPQRILPQKRNEKVLKLKIRTLCILLIVSLIIGISIGYALHKYKTMANVQCVNTLKGGGIDG